MDFHMYVRLDCRGSTQTNDAIITLEELDEYAARYDAGEQDEVAEELENLARWAGCLFEEHKNAAAAVADIREQLAKENKAVLAFEEVFIGFASTAKAAKMAVIEYLAEFD